MEKTTKREKGSQGGIISPYGFIYITTNRVNGKRYIGQKKYDTASRWKSYMGSGYHLAASIRKYGKENFDRVIVDWAYSIEELDLKEYEMIEFLGAVESDSYYNMVDGGSVAQKLKERNSIPVVMISTRQVFSSILEGADYCGVGEASVQLRLDRSHTFKLATEIPVFRKLEEINNMDNLCSICGGEFSDLLYRDSLQKLPRCDKCNETILAQEQSELDKGRVSRRELKKIGIEERKICRFLEDERLCDNLRGDFLVGIDKGLSIEQALEVCGLPNFPRISKRVLAEERPNWKNRMTYYIATENGEDIFSCQYRKDFLKWMRDYTGSPKLTMVDINFSILKGRLLEGVGVRVVESTEYQDYLMKKRD